MMLMPLHAAAARCRLPLMQRRCYAATPLIIVAIFITPLL